MSDEKKRFGLTQAEYENLMQAVRYGIIIVVTVLITFTILATVTRLFGYVPSPPANYEVTPETSAVSE